MTAAQSPVVVPPATGLVLSGANTAMGAPESVTGCDVSSASPVAEVLQLFPTDPVPENPTLEQLWDAFLSANPSAPDYFGKLARTYRDKGHGCLSMRDLFGFARVNHAAFIDATTPFALNNSFTAFMSREVVRRNPDLAGVFRFRKSVAS